MTPEQTMRDKARSYAGVYKRRGKLQQEPCQACGSSDSQMHHHDYGRPLEVVWLCAPCHLDWHKHWRDVVMTTFQLWVESKEFAAGTERIRTAIPAATSASGNAEDSISR